VRRSPYARVYTFLDVVGLRALAALRKEHKIPLQQLRKVGAELRRRFDEPWSRLTFYVVGRQLFYQESEAIHRADETGQTVMPFELTQVESDVRARMQDLRRRTARQIGHISRNRYVAANQPVLAGTRIPTDAVWEFHAAGYPTESILRQYPQLTPADVHAALAFERRRRAQAG
jgi:uncharacterized protein (DUF433 family)